MDQEGRQEYTEPPAPGDFQNSDDDEYRRDKPRGLARNGQQEVEEEDEHERETGGGHVWEDGRDRKLTRPTRGEVLDRANTFCRPCRVDFCERRPFLDHNLLVHKRRLRTKSSGRIPTPSPQGNSPSLPLTPDPEVSDQSRGGQSYGPGPVAPDLVKIRPAIPGRNSGDVQGGMSRALLPSGSDIPTAGPPRRQPEERNREAIYEGCWRSPGELSLKEDREEGEIQGLDREHGAAGGTEQEGLREKEEKKAPCLKTQGRGDPAGKDRRRSERGPLGHSEPPAKGAREERKHRRTSYGEDKEEPPEEGKEVRPEGPPARPTGHLIWKVRKQTTQGLSAESSASPAGQEEEAPEDRPLEEPKSVPGIVLVKAGAVSEGSPQRRSIPRSKATKRPSPQDDPDTAAKGDTNRKGPNSPGEKKATPSKSPRPPNAMPCPTCQKVYHGLKAYNKHQKEVHQGWTYKCEFCSRMFKTNGNKKKHEGKACH